ncbi:hypothetical protein GCM10027275_50380 [Rhabdobacter roseus]|uniref:Uncharacterized protein n=1 Tax=Rhabdobacter roseus TaxID=1655419 RepID=A0A840TT32_9BACT|nr:hypothetical protein [Rhabdobacter roseus]MBB5287111.1 hypothetical protein [Rhabdobacter roseus]
MTPTDSLFWPYLRPILEAQPGVTYVQLSDANGMDRLLEDSRSEDVYPGIFVMRPKWNGRTVDNALLLTDFQVIAYFFCPAKPDDRASQDAAYQQAEALASGVIQQLQEHRYTYQNYLDFDSIRMEPVLYHTGVDAAYGYELKFKLGLEANMIYA